MNNNILLFILIILLITGDKLTTYYSIKGLKDNAPNYNYLAAEKNPMAKFFMSKLGLAWGNVVFAIVSIGLFYLSLFLIQSCLKSFGVANYIGISWYVMILVYAFTIGNNLYFVMKHNRILP